MAHPLKKRAYVNFCEPLAYSAYASAILTYGKIVDDLNDEKGSRKLKAALVKPFCYAMRRKALKKYAELDKKVFEGLKRLSEIERQNPRSVDVPADAFGDILADILSFNLDGADEKIMRNIGRHIGRWIYIVDAADDLDEDIKKHRFNAIACLYGGPIPEEEKATVANSLKLELLAAEPAFDLIDYHELYDIEELISNIIYRGMPKAAEKALGLSCCDTNAKKTKGKKRNV
jgi:predicted hydrocarbon binding protein